jgi:hypothetical protein
MSEQSEDLEAQLASSLREYADRPELHWAPSAVVADVVSRRTTQRRRWRSLSLSAGAVAVVLLAVGVGLWAGRPPPSGIYPSMVTVSRVDYYVGAGRGLTVDEAALMPFGVVEVGPHGMPLDRFADRIAYQLTGVEPQEALVARAAPDIPDDSSPYGEWFILWGPEGTSADAYSAALCSHFDLSHPATAGFRCNEPTPPTNATSEPTSTPVATDRESPTPTTPSPVPTLAITPGPAAAETVHVLARTISAPIEATVGASGVWTGTEVIVWGGWLGDDELGFGLRGVSGDGAAYDPAQDTWRRLSEAPIEPRAGHFAVWTGDEMLIWGGYSDSGLAADGAAYDPIQDRWRPLPHAPVDWVADLRDIVEQDGDSFASIWMGREWVIAFKGIGDDVSEPIRVAAYNHQLDAWRELPTARGSRTEGIELAWTGNELILFSFELLWRMSIDGSDWQPVRQTPWGLPAYSPVWTGDQLMAVVTWWRTPSEWSFVATWDPSSDSWEPLTQPPRSARGQLLLDKQHVISLGSDLAYEIVGGVWLDVPMSVDRSDAVVVWTGRELLVWGGWECGACPNGVFQEGLLLTPDW